jgi:hypothetical protein
MNSRLRILLSAFAAVAIFAAGAAFGSHHSALAAPPQLALAQSAPVLSASALPAQSAPTLPAPVNRFGQPRTILSISLLKFRPGVSDADKRAAIEGVRTLAGQIPGIKNIWLKTSRMQPRDFDAAFVIEFASRDAADNYAESPLHEAWSKKLQAIRETSLSPQVTN